MVSRVRQVLCAAPLLVSCISSTAWADEAERPASADVGGAISPIIVTARQRVENLQDVPVAVSVVQGDELDRAYTVNTTGLSTLVPALNYSSANPRNTSFTIRGLGSSVVAVSQANDGLEPGVGFYVDQVYHARPATAAFDFTDIERIEVLRGPQGTLFGKNTTAGAINITSRLPTFTPEASEEISYGERNWLQVKASGSLPVIDDKLAVRVSGLMTRRDGVITNIRYGGHKQNNIGNQAVRGQLLFKPSDAFQLRVIADFSNFENECCTQVYLRVGTSLRPAARQYPALAAGLNYQPASTNPYDRVTDIDAALGVNTNEGGVSAIADWNIGGATITSVSAWRFWNWDAANDRDYTGVNIQVTQHIPSRQDQYSQELRIASNGDGPFHYVAGLYYFHQQLNGRPISIYGSQAAYWLIGPTFTSGATTVNVPANLLDGYGTDGRTHFRTDSYAAFGEMNYDITPRFTVTGGLRYTYEDKAGDYDSPVFGGPALTGTPAQITALTNARLSILRQQTYAAKDKGGSLSGRANLAYHFTDGIMGYASFARGFKSGGINMSGLPLTSTNQPALATAVVKPERNTTYEVGLKTQFLDNRVLFNLTGYLTKVRNFQATIVDSSQTVALRGYLSNIPEVEVKGIEADAIVRPVAGLTIRGSLAYSHGEYTNYPAGPCPLEVQTAATVPCNFTGKPLVGLPRWVETLGFDYALPVGGSGGSLVAHGDTSWRSSYYGDPSLSKYTLIDGYNLTNASIGYRSDSNWEISVFARNLFQSNYIQNLTIQAGNSGLILGTPSDPRTFGVTFRAWQ
ncbi:TonB-dependent receptor [Novosphingobium sp. G106]|uniref:TonB-dependent receptor n=1 Tax=Novosphingobium sp. G106 TaxID=2849500 RepID=UPI001C2D8A2B|nr:TonB-dependent receptor [Novosphingobium sp. G106]MBV1691600.1 TonB-dependent receptor [Novosphingobium sp. G106]